MDNLINILASHGYLLVFWIVLMEQLGLPLPAELLLLSAGAIAGRGELQFTIAFLLAVAACILSDFSWHQIGRYKGSTVLSFLCRISLTPESCVRKTRNLFFRHGAQSLLVAKFIPGVNTLAAPLSGISGIGLVRFLIFDSLGACLWSGTFLGAGYLFSDQLERAARLSMRLGTFLGVILFGGLAGYILWKYLKRRQFLDELRIARITPEELKKMIDAGEDPTIVDVRSALEYQSDPRVIQGAFYLSLEDLERELEEGLENLPVAIHPGREVVLYCN